MINPEHIPFLESLDDIVDPTTQEMDHIFELYQLYLDRNIRRYQIGCGCYNDITQIYRRLVDFYNKNKTTNASNIS